jgi:hypothetical protein
MPLGKFLCYCSSRSRALSKLRKLITRWQGLCPLGTSLSLQDIGQPGTKKVRKCMSTGGDVYAQVKRKSNSHWVAQLRLGFFTAL